MHEKIDRSYQIEVDLEPQSCSFDDQSFYEALFQLPRFSEADYSLPVTSYYEASNFCRYFPGGLYHELFLEDLIKKEHPFHETHREQYIRRCRQKNGEIAGLIISMQRHSRRYLDQTPLEFIETVHQVLESFEMSLSKVRELVSGHESTAENIARHDFLGSWSVPLHNKMMELGYSRHDLV